jgi:large subunit ribosomal protein L35
MPKTRIVPGAKKRFKTTRTGKIRRRRPYKSHLLTKKDKKRKRNLGYYTTVHKSDKDNIKRLLGMK